MARDETKTAKVVLNVLTAVVVLVALVVGIRIATESTSLSVPPVSAQTLVFSPDGTKAYVAEKGLIGVEHLGAKGVTTEADIPIPGGTVTHLIITPDGRELVAATAVNRVRGEVFTVDLRSSPPAVTAVYAGNVMESLAMAPRGGFALVGESGPITTDRSTGAETETAPGTVERLNLDTTSGTAQSAPALVGRAPVGYGIGAMAVAPSGDNAFVLNEPTFGAPERLTTLRLTTSPIGLDGSVAVSGHGLLLSPNGFTAYVGGTVVNVLADPPQLLAPPAPPAGMTSLDGFTVQSITPNGRFVYLSGGQPGAAGGLTQVVEDTSTSPPTISTFELTDCTDVAVNPLGRTVYCGAGLSYPVVPSITSLSESRGGLAGGYPVTLHGTSLSDVDTVEFGSALAAVQSVNRGGTVATVEVPAGSDGTTQVVVTTSGGVSAMLPASQFTYAPLPAVSGIVPSQGLIQGGTDVLVSGSGFTAGTTVNFGPGHPGQIISISPDGTYMAVQAPGGTGTVHVIVTTSEGSSNPAVNGRYRFVKVAPEVIAIRPDSGVAAGGYGILIGGRDMNGATAVHFGVVEAKLMQVASDGDYLGVIVPPGVGTVDVSVTTPSGTSRNVRDDQFTYTGG
jgi:hypothetical protein